MAIHKVLLNKVNLLAEMDNLTETISNYDNIEYTTSQLHMLNIWNYSVQIIYISTTENNKFYNFHQKCYKTFQNIQHIFAS